MPFPSWPSLTPPQAPRTDCWIEQLGRQRNDAYAWMRHVPAMGSRTLETLPQPLRVHLQAEMRYTDGMLAPLAPQAEQFLERMRERAPEIDVPPPRSLQGWRYGTKLPAGSAHRVFTRISPQGQEHTLFDEAQRAQGHAYYRATGHQHSPDDRFFAWAEDVTGDDRHRICLLDMDSGTLQVVVPANAFGYGGLVFAPSSRHLFWTWRDARSRPTRLYRTAVADGATTLVYEEADPALFMQISRTAANGFVTLTLAGPEVSEVRLMAADAETAPPAIVRPRQHGTIYTINEWAGQLLMLTDADGATDRKLLSLDRASLRPLRELVPHRSGTFIIDIRTFAAALVRLERQNGLHQLVLMQPDGREQLIRFDEPAYAIEIAPDQAYAAEHVRIVHQTPANPPRWIDVDLSTGACQTVGQERLRNFDPGAYRVERLHATAPDGELVPITLLSRRDAEGAAPVLLMGYGAYGIASEPLFSLPATVLVDAGFSYAIAHVRGGSEKGRRWFLEGRRMRKRNSMTDFIACAQHLLHTGRAALGQIVAHGVSAGGLLVCGAMNMAPSLWAGVMAQVPFVDMLNTMSDADHPLVPLLRPDWGDPLSDPQAYDYIVSLSPYENVAPAPYPPLLCTAGLKDDRVPYWEPAKLIANIRHLAGNSQPAILRLDLDSGHQASSGQDSEWTEAAWLWAFAQHCVRAKR